MAQIIIEYVNSCNIVKNVGLHSDGVCILVPTEQVIWCLVHCTHSSKSKRSRRQYWEILEEEKPRSMAVIRGSNLLKGCRDGHFGSTQRGTNTKGECSHKRLARFASQAKCLHVFMWHRPSTLALTSIPDISPTLPPAIVAKWKQRQTGWGVFCENPALELFTLTQTTSREHVKQFERHYM